MLLTRAEMSFDFAGATLSPTADKDVLAWMLGQFLYGEVTGVQIGQWLYDAPNYDAAKFLARQALEEMQHVGNFLRISNALGVEPRPAHWAIRFLATGMMGQSWAEHVALEMAQGEGFVLAAFYAVIDTLDHPDSVDLLRRAVKQEERHVDFGEQQTMLAVATRPWLRRRLLGLSLVSLWAVARVAAHMQKRMPSNHPVLSKLPAFLAHTNRCAETRLLRLGIAHVPLAQLSTIKKASLIAEAYAGKMAEAALRVMTAPLRWLRILPKARRLTDTYLNDPEIVRLLHETKSSDAV